MTVAGGLRERANRSPCLPLIRALRCSCSSSVPAPPGAFLSPSSAQLLFSYFGFSEGTGALQLAGNEGLQPPVGLEEGGNEAGLEARTRRGFLGFWEFAATWQPDVPLKSFVGMI